MNSTHANNTMISIETAVHLWRSGGVDSEEALEQVRQLVRSPSGETPTFREERYDKPLG